MKPLKKKGRRHSQTRKREFCYRGHAYDEVGWYESVKADGRVSRACKACEAMRRRTENARKSLKARAYKADPKDADVRRCRAELARVLKLRKRHGDEWWKAA